jgi:hypothetical protein
MQVSLDVEPHLYDLFLFANLTPGLELPPSRLFVS